MDSPLAVDSHRQSVRNGGNSEEWLCGSLGRLVKLCFCRDDMKVFGFRVKVAGFRVSVSGLACYFSCVFLSGVLRQACSQVCRDFFAVPFLQASDIYGIKGWKTQALQSISLNLRPIKLGVVHYIRPVPRGLVIVVPVLRMEWRHESPE